MKNIIYFSFAELPSQAAHSVQIMKMCHAIRSAGYGLILIAHLKADNAADVFQYYGIDGGFPIESFPMPSIRILGRLVYLILALVFMVRKGVETVVYSRDLFSSFLVSRLGIPVVYECHEVPVGFLKKALLKAVLVHRNTKLFVCISKSMKTNLKGLFQEADQDSRMLVAHDGVDLEAFDGLAEKENVRRSIGLPEDGYVIGYTGNLFKGRGVEVMVETASRIEDSLFVVVGGYEKDVGLVADQVKTRGIENLILTGHVPNKLIPMYLSAFDLLIMPYQYKVTLKGNKRNTALYMSPLKMFEYMASGKPIVASKLDVLEEVLENGRNAILVQPDGINAWCEAIVLLKGDKSLAQRIGRRAKEDAKKYSWAERASSILKRMESP